MAKNIFGRIEIVLGDITADVDAIVNAANESLWAAGVWTALFTAGRTGVAGGVPADRRLSAGEAAMTKDMASGKACYSCSRSIWWTDKGRADLLSQCYRRVFALLAKSGLQVWLPSISTGAFGFLWQGGSHCAH